ncbi:MAG: [FeFe] hydrogenase H-cluster radical SAM maturase HydG, partial [Endomicrobiia bacterium]|nr:[FeFe] hydrogenase H-cluster radical SAM maturase HydG [Endomicrobiia bacterium]
VNDCEYCNFHSRNASLPRRSLSEDDIIAETSSLLKMGHKRLLLEAGESPDFPVERVVAAIRAIYSVKTRFGAIRRVNVNIAAASTEDYLKLKSDGIGTYQLFQETYHPETYLRVHPRGPKSDYTRQITAHDRAFLAGIADVGLGALFGLYDWRFEVVCLVAHARYLEEKFGVGPHTISVPRFRPAPSVEYSPPAAVSDEDFLRIIAILRLAVPYTGLIISTRERPDIRAAAFKIGISQASAASATRVGGYRLSEDAAREKSAAGISGQFAVADERPLSEVVAAALEDGMIPSFCTACYRRGRTGEKFMELAKPAEIHNFCLPNAILTFAEYLEDFAAPDVYRKGMEVLEKTLAAVEEDAPRANTRSALERIKKGERDVYF